MSSFRVPAANRNDCLGEKNILSCILYNMYFVILAFRNASQMQLHRYFNEFKIQLSCYWKKGILAIGDKSPAP